MCSGDIVVRLWLPPTLTNLMTLNYDGQYNFDEIFLQVLWNNSCYLLFSNTSAHELLKYCLETVIYFE